MTQRLSGSRDLGVSGLLRVVDTLLRANHIEAARHTLEERLPNVLLLEMVPLLDVATPAYGVHYTTVNAAVSILRTGGFRMYNTESSRDPLEGAALDRKAVYDHLRSRHEWLPELPEDSYPSKPQTAYAFCSFPGDVGSEGSKPEDDLVRWRLYGDDGRGCSIKFNVPPAALPMYTMNYTKTGDYRRDRLPKSLPSIVLLGDRVGAIGRSLESLSVGHREPFHSAVRDSVHFFLNWYRHLVKDRHYSDEKEIRALEIVGRRSRVEYHAEGSLVRRFVRGPRVRDCLRSRSAITVGPAVRDPHVAAAYLRRCLIAAGCTDTAVTTSDAPYRS